MVSLSCNHRRGTAMLVVLGVLVLTVTAVATTARLASTVALQRDADHADAIARDLDRQCDALIQTWLRSDSATAVLPPDATIPAIALPAHAWMTDGAPCEIQITAFDQCGMVAMTAPSGDPSRGTLPAHARQVLNRVHLTSRDLPGLDLLAAHLDGGVHFPPAFASESRHEYESAQPADEANAPRTLHAPDEPSDATETEPAPHALGAVLASHQPGGAININTAPQPLLEIALRNANLGGLDEILSARENGRVAAIPGSAAERGGRRGRNVRAPRGVTAVSTAWAFRINIRVGTMMRSWWRVYTQGNSRRRGSWQCVQQLVIAE